MDVVVADVILDDLIEQEWLRQADWELPIEAFVSAKSCLKGWNSTS